MNFSGHTILVLDPDKEFLSRVSKEFTKFGGTCFSSDTFKTAIVLFSKYDFDLVISNYYLPDGLIHQVIDWTKSNLEEAPIFCCVGYPTQQELLAFDKYSISDRLSKTDIPGILTGLSHLLFDFNKFYQDLLEMSIPTQLRISAMSDSHFFEIIPIEVFKDSLYFSAPVEVPKGHSGKLRFLVDFSEGAKEFIVSGHFGDHGQGGQVFVINKSQIQNWTKFLDFLDKRQLDINRFLKKAAGE